MSSISDNASDTDYSDMPPLIPVDQQDDMKESDDDYLDMPPLYEPIQNPLYDQFVNSLQIGDTFKTPANYHIIYRGKRENLDVYDVDIVNLGTNEVSHSYYSKLGLYISLSDRDKVEATASG